MSQPMVGPLCSLCRHIRADYSCAAFQGNIPADIVAGLDHTTPYPGDGGLQFEPRPPGEPAPDFQDLMFEEALEEGDFDTAYFLKSRRPAPMPFGFPKETRDEFLRRCVAENNPDLDPWADLPPDCVA